MPCKHTRGDTNLKATLNPFQLTRCSIKVEGDVCDGPVFAVETRQLVLHDDGFAGAGEADQHDRTAHGQQHVHEVADTGRFRGVHQHSLPTGLDVCLQSCVHIMMV